MTTKDIGSRKDIYIVTETTAGTVKPWDGTDAVKMSSAFVMNKTRMAQGAAYLKSDTRSETEDVPLSLECTVQAGPFHLLGASAQGGTPDLSPALETMFTKSTITATTIAASPSPSTTAFKLADDYLDAGEMGFIEVENADGVVIEKRHFYVVSKDVSDVLTIWPDLDNAPTEGDHVKACVNYNLNMDNSNTITIAQGGNLHSEIATGVKFSSANFEFRKGEIAELTLDGKAIDVLSVIETTLDGAINDSATEIVVDDPGIDDETFVAIGDELLDITAVAADKVTHTVTRAYDSTVAAAHNDGVFVGLHRPTKTVTGNPITTLGGGLWMENIAGSGVKMKATEVSISDDEKLLYQEYLGDEGKPSDHAHPEDREIVWTITVDLNAETAEKLQQIKDSDSMKIFYQAGSTAARAISFYSPAAVFDIPEKPEAKGEVVQMTITSRQVLSTSAENALSIAM